MKHEKMLHVKHKRFTRKEIGDIGESIAKKFLVKHGFVVLLQKYSKRSGEIDIIALKDSVYRFVEVKSLLLKNNVSHVTSLLQNKAHKEYVSRETYIPEYNFTKMKLKKLNRTALGYLDEFNVSQVAFSWQVDLIAVKLDLMRKKASISFYQNIIDS